MSAHGFRDINTEASEALVLTPEQLATLQEITPADVNGNVVVYGGQVARTVQFCWSDHAGNLWTRHITVEGDYVEEPDNV